jgi:transcriptional regulator with XRE-family HTH domain
MSLGARIKAFRNYLDLNQDEFAEKTNTRKRTSVSFWENNKQSPDAAAIAEMGRLGVNLNWLLIGVGDMLREESSQMYGDFDADLLDKIIIMVEKALNDRDLEMKPEKKSKAIIEMYKFAILYGEAPMQDNVIKLLRIA